MHSQSISTGLGQQHLATKDSMPEDVPLPPNTTPGSSLRRNAHSSSSISRPKPLATPSKPFRILPSAPASPPTPAPSPTPHQRVPSWHQQHQSCEDDDAFVRDAVSNFTLLGKDAQKRFLTEILNLCSSRQLGFVQQYVSPMLKRDPFKVLPNELCLRVCLSFLEYGFYHLIRLPDRC